MWWGLPSGSSQLTQYLPQPKNLVGVEGRPRLTNFVVWPITESVGSVDCWTPPELDGPILRSRDSRCQRRREGREEGTCDQVRRALLVNGIVEARPFSESIVCPGAVLIVFISSS